MAYFKSLMCIGVASEEDKEEKLEELEEARWNEFKNRKKTRSIALKAGYRREVIERQRFFERMEANPLLDDLAWDRVALFVKEPKDLVNMWGMCEPWMNSVKRRMTTDLFAEVFPKLVEGASLSTNDILNLRSVCKTWRNSIDRYVRAQQLWTKRGMDFSLFNVQVPSPRLSVNLYGGIIASPDAEIVKELQQSLLRLVNRNQADPIGTTKLFVQILAGYQNEHANNFSVVSAWLIGALCCRVTHLYVECEEQDELCLHIFWIIRLVGYLTDLETITVRVIPNQSAYRLQRILQELLFLPLKNLRTIVTSGFHPLLISAMLKTYGSKLETLVIDHGSPEIMAVIQKQDLPCLKRLDFASQRYSENSTGGLSLKTLVLEEVDLRFIQISKLDVSRLLSSFNKFGRTLKKLQLALQTAKEQPLGFKKQLVLPVLETLKLALDGIHLGNIDFLIPLVRLKELDLTEVINWTNKISSEQEKREYIKFSKYKDHLYDSNIWRMFPELRNVRITQIIKNVDGVVNKNVKQVFVYNRYNYNQL